MAHYKLSGGCACGSVHYEFDGELAMAVHCHCRDCQRSSGSGSAAVFAASRDKIKLTGKTSAYQYKGDSGNAVTRHFCPNCGSPLFSDVEILPDLMFVRIASLDDPSQVRPSMHIYCDSSQVWDRPNDPLPKFGKMPS
jgi:hypothetical protein